VSFQKRSLRFKNGRIAFVNANPDSQQSVIEIRHYSPHLVRWRARAAKTLARLMLGSFDLSQEFASAVVLHE
jgi:hypothetical protein